MYVQDGDVDAPAVSARSTASAELLEFTDKYLDADEGPNHIDNQRKHVLKSV